MPKGSGLTKPMKLSDDLADIVGKKEASRPECVKLLWAYLKKHNLQDRENKQYFTPDDDDDDEELFDIDSGSSDEDIQFIGEDELDDSTNEDENEEDSNDSSEAEDEDADEDEAEQEGDEAEEDDDDEDEVVEGDQEMASDSDDESDLGDNDGDGLGAQLETALQAGGDWGDGSLL